jgi:hypothetical protein
VLYAPPAHPVGSVRTLVALLSLGVDAAHLPTRWPVSAAGSNTELRHAILNLFLHNSDAVRLNCHKELPYHEYQRIA